MRVAILTNGEYGDYSFCQSIKNYDFFICADNGMKHAKALGISPHYIVGDFDSGNEKETKSFPKAKIYKAKTQKDETDTELALELALGLKPSFIDIFGGLGSRIDHSLANIHLLYKGIDKKVSIRLLNPNNIVQLVEKEVSLKGKKGELVSLLPLTMSVTGVYTKGLGYPVVNGNFKIGKPYGVSNYMIEEKALVSIETGLLLVMQVKD